MAAKLTRTEQVLAVLKAGGRVGVTSDGTRILRDKRGQEVDAWLNAIRAAERIHVQSQHQAHIAKLKAKGIAVGAYDPPCGCAPIETRIPDRGQTWDTMATCPTCLALHFRVATFDGVRVDAVPA